MENGIIYWNSGTKLLVRLTTSLISLREHYQGNITVLLNTDVPEQYIQILKKNNIDYKIVNYDVGHKKALIAKTQLHKWTPYENTILIDGDTLILKNFDEIFEKIKEHTFVVTRFADWGSSKCDNSGGKRIGSRIWNWKDIITKEKLDIAINYGSAINIGVFGFKKEATIFNEWENLALRGINTYIPDELSCQILVPNHEHYLVDQYYNSSCRFSKITKNTRVIHYHGRKHASLEKTKAEGGPPTAQLWIDSFKKAYHNNTYDMQEIVKNWPDKHASWIKL